MFGCHRSHTLAENSCLPCVSNQRRITQYLFEAANLRPRGQITFNDAEIILLRPGITGEVEAIPN